jgi:DNA-binding transcriptional LysR family regulator
MPDDEAQPSARSSASASSSADESGAPVPNLHLQQLRYLVEVVERGSLGRAAETLHVSQPALSQAMAELERRLGVPLFERAGRGRRPTAAGRETLRFASEVLRGARALTEHLAALRAGDSGALDVGMIDAASLYVLPDVVRRFRAQHPAVELKVAVETSGVLLQRLRAFALDLAFVVGPVQDSDLRAAEVLREPLHIYLPIGATGEPQQARWLLYPEGSRTRAIIDAAFARRAIQPRIALESGNPAVLRQRVALGLGWSVLPQAVAESDGPASGMKRGDLLAYRPLDAVRRRDSPPDARVDAFLRLAIEVGRGVA